MKTPDVKMLNAERSLISSFSIQHLKFSIHPSYRLRRSRRALRFLLPIFRRRRGLDIRTSPFALKSRYLSVRRPTRLAAAGATTAVPPYGASPDAGSG